MKIKSIKVMFGGNEITIQDGRKFRSFQAKDGKEKIEVDGILYDVNNTQWEVKKSIWQPLRKVD